MTATDESTTTTILMRTGDPPARLNIRAATSRTATAEGEPSTPDPLHIEIDPEDFLHAAIYDLSIPIDPKAFLTVKPRTTPYRVGSELGYGIKLVLFPRLLPPQSRYDAHFEFSGGPLQTTANFAMTAGEPYVIKTALTGAFVCAGLAPEDPPVSNIYDVLVDEGSLVKPNEMRTPPEPSKTTKIPAHSPRILVGAGDIQEY